MNAFFRQEEQADQRAIDLLLEHLDEGQRASYEATGTFMVEAASGRAYTLGRGNKAAVCPEINRWWCLEPERDVPRGDWLLAVKLFLEADEAGFLAEANEFVLDSIRESRCGPVIQNQWGYLSPMARNCRCDIEFTGPIHFDTLAQARAWLETHGLEYEVDDLLSGTTYTINGRPSDRHTWELLMEAHGG